MPPTDPAASELTYEQRIARLVNDAQRIAQQLMAEADGSGAWVQLEPAGKILVHAAEIQQLALESVPFSGFTSVTPADGASSLPAPGSPNPGAERAAPAIAAR